jgi:hypothetical protein
LRQEVQVLAVQMSDAVPPAIEHARRVVAHLTAIVIFIEFSFG